MTFELIWWINLNLFISISSALHLLLGCRAAGRHCIVSAWWQCPSEAPPLYWLLTQSRLGDDECWGQPSVSQQVGNRAGNDPSWSFAITAITTPGWKHYYLLRCNAKRALIHMKLGPWQKRTEEGPHSPWLWLWNFNIRFPALFGNGRNTAPAGNTRHYSHGQLQCLDQSWGHQLGSLLPSITGSK